jgi:hypothetical protein
MMRRINMYNNDYDKCFVSAGFDTIRIKLERAVGNKGNLIITDHARKLSITFNKSFRNNQSISKSYFSYESNMWFLNDVDSGCSFCKFYSNQNIKQNQNSLFIELYGLRQFYGKENLHLSHNHIDVLQAISKIPNYVMTIEKIDICLDYYFDYYRSFVFSGISTKENQLERIKLQNNHPKHYLGRFPTYKFMVPIGHYGVISSILRGTRLIKHNKNTERTVSYYRYRRPLEGQVPTTEIKLLTCEFEEATHIEINVKNKEIYFDILNLFDGNVNYSEDFDIDKITVSKGRVKLSGIKYDKSENGRILTRVELYKYVDSLELNDSKTYEQLHETAREEAEEIRIFILNPETDIKEYFRKFKKSNKNRQREVPFIPVISKEYDENKQDFGRVIGVNWDNFDDQIKTLEEAFNVKPSSPTTNALRTPIRSRKRGG